MSRYFFIQRRAIDVQHFCGLGLVIVDLLQGEQDGSFFSPVVHLFQRIWTSAGRYSAILSKIKGEITALDRVVPDTIPPQFAYFYTTAF